ncbi:hypothetical protein [Mycolicibacterium vanbaalenii]|uniref:Uncharacterized protein n=1 Tax=Mycolicibacterium vanbaalenii (strain DSM 7251 / JCM 13017 / BCRC 16820 / KCTC 9966 / NRRL B-24157 / PYR-1) TaxID=350058 RepID=A1THU8_MYCVP|nr:hypothetical protein [Mycolicibacterium vanbaalenii]ABM16748.1 hypothetical protein Mvan_5992 [Mycolicibacterium vanbaalenii PYR-1]MCV7126975.1 hypothetical protein [Mycolicibacterium vanbaalenii PYR-1]
MLTLNAPLIEKEAAAAVSIDRTMRAKLPDLPNPIVASWDERQRLVIDRGDPWIVGPLEIDPYLTKTGGYPFPLPVADQLQRIADGGARFHRIAIAHEVDPTGPVKSLLPKVTRTGLAITPKEARGCLGQIPAAAKPKELAASMDKAIKKVFTTAGRVAAGAAEVLSAPMLDPIVFGVVAVHGRPATGRPAIYYPLAAWKW